MRIEIPRFCVVALVGATGSGKSTFAQTHFRSTEVLSSDFFRAMVSDDENDMGATKAAFDALYYVAEKRLESGKMVVVDATNVQQNARANDLTDHTHHAYNGMYSRQISAAGSQLFPDVRNRIDPDDINAQICKIQEIIHHLIENHRIRII